MKFLTLIKDSIRDFIYFFKNTYRFKKQLSTFRDFDHYHCTSMFIRSLEILRKGIHKRQRHIGYEENVKNIGKTIRTLRRLENGFVFDLAERHFKTKFLECNNPEIKNKMSLYLQEKEKLIRRKAIKYLTDSNKGVETWWD